MNTIATSMNVRKTVMRVFRYNIKVYCNSYMSNCRPLDPLSDDFSKAVADAQLMLRKTVASQLCTPQCIDAITLTTVKEHIGDPCSCGYPKPTDSARGISAGALYAVIYFSITGLRADANTCLSIDREEINLCDKAVQNAEYSMNTRNDTYASKSETKNEVTAAVILLAIIFAVAGILFMVAQFSS